MRTAPYPDLSPVALESATIQVHDVKTAYAQNYSHVVSVETPTLVLNAVSGVGRSTVGQIIQRELGRSVGIIRNFTTRNPRSGDEADRLIFGSRAKFKSLRQAGEVLCYINWEGNGHQYALLDSEIERMSWYEVALFETTHFGWPLKAQNPRLVTNVWLTCADRGTIRNRLAVRGTETVIEQEQRLRAAIDDQAYILARKDELMRLGKVDAVIEVGTLSPDEIAHSVLSLMWRSREAVL